MRLENGPTNPVEYVPLLEGLLEKNGNILSITAPNTGDLKSLGGPEKRALRFATWDCVRSNPLMCEFGFLMQRRTERAIQPLLLQAADTLEDPNRIDKALSPPPSVLEGMNPSDVTTQSPLLKAIVDEVKNEELQKLINQQGNDKTISYRSYESPIKGADFSD